MSRNLVSDLSNLTLIKEHTLNKLISKSNFIICHDILDSILTNNELTEIDIGIGTLSIKRENDGIRYRFVPSRKLEEAILFTVENKKSPLTCEIETALVDRIEKTYKELF